MRAAKILLINIHDILFTHGNLVQEPRKTALRAKAKRSRLFRRAE